MVRQICFRFLPVTQRRRGAETQRKTDVGYCACGAITKKLCVSAPLRLCVTNATLKNGQYNKTIYKLCL